MSVVGFYYPVAVVSGDFVCLFVCCCCVCVEKSLSIKVHRVTDPLLFFKSTFKFSQTVGEMVFVSSEVDEMRLFLVQSIVRWCCGHGVQYVVSFPV